EPFADSFKATGTDLARFLFPYGLIANPGLRKADLFADLRARWSGFSSPQEIITDLERFRGTYVALEAGLADPKLPAAINRGLRRLFEVGRPSSTYAFILRLVEGWREGEISELVVIDILDRLESFLFRRAVMGIEPTGLHAVFKGLWQELVDGEGPSGVTGATFQAAIAGKPTILWPSDAQFAEAIRTGNLYNRKIRNYALREHETSLSAETASDVFQVEHVAPQSPTDAWREKMGEPYDRLIHTWGNLVPISDKMNPSVGQKSFAAKKAEYARSRYANARQIAETCEDWSAATLEARNAQIAEWARTRWPH
ncbi:MAG: HNH endonuclease family protein, partial [Brevundimonas sp.]